MSVGSLPDYDDLKDSQLPVARSYLDQWLSSPDNVVTKEAVKEAREKIRAAKKADADPAGNNGQMDRQTQTIMRQQVRDMMQQWKNLKRDQRNRRREIKRQKRAHRRAEKRERRQVKRDLKRARRQAKRQGKQAEREAKRNRRGADRSAYQDHSPIRRPQGGPGPVPGPSPFGQRGGCGPFGQQGGSFGGFGRGRQAVFPGAGHGPGARGCRGGHAGPFPFGGRGGAFPAPGGPVPHAEFQRNMQDWGRRMDEWGRSLSGSLAGPAVVPQPRFPGAWPTAAAADAAAPDYDAKDRHVYDLGSGVQEAGISMRDNDEDGDGAHAASRAMYRSLEARQQELQGRRDALAGFRGDSQGEDSNGEKQGASTLVGLLAEIEELEKAVGQLTLEADGQFAKELAALEG